MALVELCSVKDLPVGKQKNFKVKGQNILLFHLKKGFFATQNHCTHAFWPLEGGKVLSGHQIRCPFHRAVFDIPTGKVVKWANFPPGIQVLNLVRGAKGLKTYPVSEKAGKIFVQLKS